MKAIAFIGMLIGACEGESMNSKKVIGNVSISLIILAFILCLGEPDGKSIGDYVFNSVGISAWSNGSTGLHYTALFSLTLFFVGIIGARIYYGSIKPRYVLLVIILLAVYPNVFSTVKGFVKAHSKGLNAIEYVKKDSSIKYSIHDGDKTVKITTSLNLINHGNQTIKFQLDLKPSEQMIKDTFKKNFGIDVTDFKESSQVSCTISPNGHSSISVELEAGIDSNARINASGVINGPGIILKNEEQQIEFTGRRD